MLPSVKIPYDYQEKAINSFFEYYKYPANVGNPLIQIPTGGGKSLIIAEIINRIQLRNSNVKILCLTHTKEIIEQDSEELKGQAPHINYSIYSSGMGKKCLKHKVIFAGIQSIWNKHLEVGFVDLIIIDEAHLCPTQDNGRYREFIKQLTKINPYVRIFGLSATPWRLDNGSLISGDERIFDCIIYELSILELIQKGKLSPIVTPKEKLTEADFSDLKLNKMTGEYTTASVENAVEKIVKPALSEALALAKDRKSWIVFCPSVRICAKVKEILNLNGVTAYEVTGATPKKKRKQLIKDFKANKFTALITVDALTTGFNAPNVDCMVCLRATHSSSLWIQMLGRAMRIAPNKVNALLLDYGANIERHGPIDKIKPVEKIKRKKKGEEEVITQRAIKVCPRCTKESSPNVQACPWCNYEYPILKYIEEKASRNEIFSAHKEPAIIDVSYLISTRHKKTGSPDSVKVMYVCANGKSYFEWLHPEHTELMAKSKTIIYFHDIKMPTPRTVDELLQIKLPRPKQIRVDESGKYPEILQRFY